MKNDKCEVCQITTTKTVIAPCGHTALLCGTCQNECPLALTDVCAACDIEDVCVAESKEDE